MATFGGMFGLAGGAGGTGFDKPTGAEIVPGTNAAQIQNSYGGVNQSLATAQDLLQVLQAQNGLANQNQVYGQLQGVAAGTGPNPAQAMLNQATGQNVAQQAALMAGQRGASSNPALMARQIAQMGSNVQQQAAGQGATMQAQQSLNALGAAGNMATQQATQQIGQSNTNAQLQMAQQQNLLNALAAQNQANVGMQSNINNANANLAGQSMQGQQKMIGGLMNAAGGLGMLGEANKANIAAGKTLMAEGGSVPGKAQVAGNSYSNDKVPALLSPGELVVDRETMASPGVDGHAARLLSALIEAKNRGQGNNGNRLARGGFAQNPELMANSEYPQPWDDLTNALSRGGSQEAYDQSMASLPKSPGEAIAQEVTGGQPINPEPTAAAQAPAPAEVQTDRVPATQAAPASTVMPSAKPELANVAEVPPAPQSGLAPKAAPTAQPAATAAPDQAQAPAEQPVTAPTQAAKPRIGPKTYEEHVQEAKTELDQKSKAWAQDLANGHITPKTYSSMFAEKSTLGKIGTIFGLLMSGAGSGLAGQQNAFLAAMDKTINDDLEAQKQSKSNAINFLKLDQEKAMQAAQIEQMKLAGKVSEVQAKSMLADLNTKQHALAKIKMNETAFHELTKQVQKYPVGHPDRQKAEQTLAMLYPIIKDENLSLMDKAAVAAAYSKVNEFGGSSAGKQTEGDFVARMNAMEKMNPEKSKAMRSRYVPGVGEASVDVPPKAFESFNAFSVLDKTIERAKAHQEEHKTIGTFKGSAAEAKGDSLKKNIMTQLSVLSQLGAISKDDAVLLGSMVPTIGTIFDAKAQAKLDELKSMVTTRQGSLKSTYGIRPFEGTQTEEKTPAKEQIKVVNGVKYKRGPNGEAIPVQ